MVFFLTAKGGWGRNTSDESSLLRCADVLQANRCTGSTRLSASFFSGIADGSLLYVGKDKYENEDLIKYGWCALRSNAMRCYA